MAVIEVRVELQLLNIANNLVYLIYLEIRNNSKIFHISRFIFITIEWVLRRLNYNRTSLFFYWLKSFHICTRYLCQNLPIRFRADIQNGLFWLGNFPAWSWRASNLKTRISVWFASNLNEMNFFTSWRVQQQQKKA